MPATLIWALTVRNMSDGGSKFGAVERWDIPAIDGANDRSVITAARLQELQQEAWDEAYQEGLAAGRQAGQAEIAAQVANLRQACGALARPLDELDETVVQQLVELAITIAKQLFRREIQVSPDHVVGVVRDAIQQLPVACRNVEVRLHPDDARLVADALSPASGEQAWRIVEDALIERGGCTVNTENSYIDLQSDTRFQAIVSAIIGDERSAS